MFPGAGQHDNESREDYLKRLKDRIQDPEYIEKAIDELAVHLTKGVEKGLSKSDGSTTETTQKTK